MPRLSYYKRISDRNSWNERNMALAIEAIKEKKMGYLKASKTFKVPHPTLRRRCNNSNKFAVGTSKELGNFKAVFSKEQEEALVKHLLENDLRFYGFTKEDVRSLAYEFAEKLKIKHNFCNKSRLAGECWLYGFRKRNPTISLREPEPTSIARARGFNRPQVEHFFKLLNDIGKYFKECDIYNMDESALTNVQSRLPKVFSEKGRKQVGSIVSAERGIHVTVVLTCNALGSFLPPALILPRKKFNPELYDGAPPLTLKLHNESGYMTGDLFLKYMKHFVEYSHASLEHKVILILDGHCSHKNVEAVEYARANGVIILCLPPHTTHHMQPLDVAVFGPMRSYFDREIGKWLNNHIGRALGLRQISGIFSQVYDRSATSFLQYFNTFSPQQTL